MQAAHAAGTFCRPSTDSVLCGKRSVTPHVGQSARRLVTGDEPVCRQVCSDARRDNWDNTPWAITPYGLQNPTAIAVRGKTVYVPSTAYLTAKDPNLVLADLKR